MNYRKLLENLGTKTKGDVTFRRYNLSEIISESYKSFYNCESDSNIMKLVESHLEDVRKNPTEVERLSRQLCNIKHIQKMLESKDMEDSELLVPEEFHSKVEPETEDIKESKDEKMTPSEMKAYWDENKDKDPILSDYESYDDWYKVSKENGYVSDEDEDLLENTDLTDEEVAELTKHLEEIRKNKKVAECNESKEEEKSLKEEVSYTPTKEEALMIKNYIKFKYSDEVKEQDYLAAIATLLPDYDNVATDIIDNALELAGIKIIDYDADNESKTYESLILTRFNKNSAGKAFVKTFKKLAPKLHEGTALTRQESISLYKAANSAMTHLSVELEHNPEFLDTFKESVTLLSVDVAKLLESMKNDKAPSKATMKSLAKFSEALLREAEEEEELPPIEDEDDEIIAPEEEVVPEEEEESEESEEFDQEYADARVEIHKELVDEFSDSEDPEVQEKITQDAEEVLDLPGLTDEQRTDIAEELGAAETEVIPEEDVIEDTEEVEEKEEISLDDDEITEDELEALKKHLTEMRAAKVEEPKEKKIIEGRRLKRKE